MSSDVPVLDSGDVIDCLFALREKDPSVVDCIDAINKAEEKFNTSVYLSLALSKEVNAAKAYLAKVTAEDAANLKIVVAAKQQYDALMAEGIKKIQDLV
jgi:hypothetical protein